MPPINSTYLEHQLKRWMRPDAHHFVRPDWRRFVQPGFENDRPFALYQRKYSPGQPRVPAGNREGGQWTDKPSPSAGASSESRTTELSAASKAKGHHYMPRAVFEKKGLSEEAKAVFEKATTGPLLDVRGHTWDKEHRIYSNAVDEAFDRYLSRTNTLPGNMTGDQAREFLATKIFGSTDPRIKNYNTGIQIRENALRFLRRGGRE